MGPIYAFNNAQTTNKQRCNNCTNARVPHNGTVLATTVRLWKKVRGKCGFRLTMREVRVY